MSNQFLDNDKLEEKRDRKRSITMAIKASFLISLYIGILSFIFQAEFPYKKIIAPIIFVFMMVFPIITSITYPSKGDLDDK